MAKLETAKAIVKTVQTLSHATDLSSGLVAEYFDCGAFEDRDLVALGITAETLAACITLLQQVDLLMIGEATYPSIYRTTLNKVRRI